MTVIATVETRAEAKRIRDWLEDHGGVFSPFVKPSAEKGKWDVLASDMDATYAHEYLSRHLGEWNE